MATARVVPLLAGASVLLASLVSASWAQDGPLAVGPNINMVSGTDWPEGDPFLRQQNEPSIAFSSRNKLHMLAGANDYRTVDVPGDFEAGATGDSWLSYFWSTNGGGTWKSTLIPCYPQDDSPECASSPLNGYAAGADPVVRAGAHGLFYYAGIAFERNDNPRSQIFVSRFIDLNNDEGGDPIRYIDTVQVDVDQTGDRFLDKVWVAVDVPRTGAASKTFSVRQRDGSMVDQTVSCGNIYVAYAALTGDGETLRSEIMLSSSTDCGDSWTTPQPISEPDTLNQGANIAIHPLTGQIHVGWRRFDTVEAFLGTPAVSCAKPIRDWRRRRKARVAVDWPIDNLDIGDERLTREQALDLLGQPGLLPSIRLAQFLVAAKLNLISGGGQATDSFDPAEWTRTLSGLIDETDEFFRDKPLRAIDAGWFSNPRTLFFPSGLNFRERRDARNLRIAIRDIYLGSDECVATDGTDPITTGSTNAMVATSSTDGASWTPPVTVAEIRTFDQGGTNFSFRTTAYPTLAVDKQGRVYMAYAARGFATLRPDEVEGDARIVLSISNDGGTNWQAPYPVDDDPEKPGHQFKPSLLFAGGRLVVVFYDLRADVSGLFERFIYDVPEPDRLRHTLDVRAASANVLAGPMMPEFTLYDVTDRRDSQQASRYAFVTTGNGVPVESVQLQYMVPNLPTHSGGTQPFIGDYVDVSTKTILKEGDGWRFATEPGDVDVYQAVWTDNRDITPPPDGDWTRYQPLNLSSGGGGSVSIFDGSPIPACEPGVTSQFTGTRNQNIYTAALSEGLIVSAPGGNRPLGAAPGDTEPLERAYVVFVQNVTAFDKTFLLTLSAPATGSASFEQFSSRSSIDVEVPPFSSTVETVFASSPNPDERVAVLVQEVDALGNVLPGGLFSTVLLNADPSAPPPTNPQLQQAETHTPTILNPTILNPTILNPTILNPTILNPTILNTAVFNPTILNPTILNTAVFNPTILNPTILNTAVFNPTILNPAILNPTILNPTILNPTILNQAVYNPTILNPTILNPTILNSAISDPMQESAEITFAVQNDGTATSSYDINLASSQGADDGLTYQLLVYRLNKTPVADGCSLEEEASQELIANVLEPGNLLDPAGGDGEASFYVEPGEEVFVTIRILPDTTQPVPGDPGELDENTLDLSIAVVPQAVDSEVAEMGETEPTGDSTVTAPVPPVVIDTQEIPDGDVNQPYIAALEASGGVAPLSWSLAMGGELLPGLSLSADGIISGTPTEPGGLVAPVRVTDGIQVAEAMFTATIEPPPLFINTTTLPDGEVDEPYPATALQSSGGFGEISWALLSGSLPPGLVLASDGTLSGTPTADGVFDFIVEASDDFQAVDQSLTISVAANDVIGGTGGSPFSLACPAGTVGIGLRGRAAQDIDRIELVCAEITAVNGGFPEIGSEVSGGITGTLGGTDFGEALICPPFTVLKGLRATERTLGGGNVIVDQLGVTCIDSGGDLVFLPGTNALLADDDAGGPVEQLNCPIDEFVTAVAGRNATLLDQVGVSCAPVGGEFVAADIPPKVYGVAVASPGFLARSGRVLEFNQSPRDGIAFDFSESTGDALNRPFAWDVVAGDLVLTYNNLPGVETFESLEGSTATPEQITLIQSLPTFTGQLEARQKLAETIYSLIAEVEPLLVTRQDTQIIEYEPITVPVSPEYPTGILQLPPRTLEQSSSAGTLRDAATAPVVSLSADCSSQPCVPGSWGGTARYQPGTRWFNDEPYPVTNYGDVLNFATGASQTVSGDISSITANWSVTGGSLQIDYIDGWTQTVTVVGVNGLEYGMFSEYSNGSDRYASYDIWVKRDPGFNFSEAYLDSPDNFYWNGEINAWIPGNVRPDGTRVPEQRFGWELDAGTDPNSGFNLNVSPSGPNGEELTLFLRPNEWAIDPVTGVVKIDRFLDTQFDTFDRFWRPIASTTVDGDRQFYVIELERREDGLLFPARMNIEREQFDDRSDYDTVQVLDPVIESDGLITNVSPQPAAAGFGQLLVVTGTNLPIGPNAQVFINQFGVTYQGFSFGNNTSTNHLIRLVLAGAPSQPGPGPATLQLSEAGANAPRTPEFPIQIEAIPTAPELLDARPTLFSAPVSTFPIDGEVSLRTFNTDTSGARATFVGSGVNETVLSLVTSSSGVTDGLLQSFNVPSGIALGAAIDVSVTTTVNGETSPPSNSLTLYACEPGNITVDGNNVVNSTVGVGVAPDDQVFVRYDLAAALFAADLSSASLTVSGAADVNLVAGGAGGDSFAIFSVLAGANGQSAGADVTLAAGSFTLLGEPGDVLVFAQTFETASDAVSDISPLYVTGPACQ